MLSQATLLGTLCLYRVGLPSSFKTNFIHHGIDSARCWKHSSNTLGHIDMMTSQSLWIGWLHIHNFKPLFHHILKVLYWIRIWWLLVHQTCHFQEIHLQWFELCKYVKVYFYSSFHRHESQITVQELKHNITKVAGDSAESAKWSWSGPIALVAHTERLCPS